MATDGDGLIRFNPGKQEAHIYTASDGLVSNSINSLLEDNDGRIWFSTEKELYCLDLAGGIVVGVNDFLGIGWGRMPLSGWMTVISLSVRRKGWSLFFLRWTSGSVCRPSSY